MQITIGIAPLLMASCSKLRRTTTAHYGALRRTTAHYGNYGALRRTTAHYGALRRRDRVGISYGIWCCRPSSFTPKGCVTSVESFTKEQGCSVETGHRGSTRKIYCFHGQRSIPTITQGRHVKRLVSIRPYCLHNNNLVFNGKNVSLCEKEPFRQHQPPAFE